MEVVSFNNLNCYKQPDTTFCTKYVGKYYTYGICILYPAKLNLLPQLSINSMTMTMTMQYKECYRVVS